MKQEHFLTSAESILTVEQILESAEKLNLKEELLVWVNSKENQTNVSYRKED